MRAMRRQFTQSHQKGSGIISQEILTFFCRWLGVTEVLAQNTGIFRTMLQEYYSNSNIKIEYTSSGQKDS